MTASPGAWPTRSRRFLDGHNHLTKIILGVRFADGMEVVESQDQAAVA